MSSSRPALIAPRRTLLQGLLFSLWFAIPFCRPGGVGLLRLDLPQLTLELGGGRLHLEELFLFLLLTVVLLLLFLLLTLALGRIWCGWGCPQTALVDLAEWFARQIGIRVAAGKLDANLGQRLALHTVYLLVSLLLGASLVWYFIPPVEFVQRIGVGRLGWPATTTLLLGSGLVYFDLALLRRLLCREFCPYGRFQAVLVDAGTLTLRWHPFEAPRCIHCGACVRACPVGIDIRRGEQVECINCGRCLDACRRVMHARGETGIIRYTFGTADLGPRALLNPRLLLVGGALLVAIAIFAGAVLQRSAASLKLGRSAAASRPLADGRSAVFFTVYVQNRSKAALHAGLTAQLRDTPASLSLLGPVDHLILEPGAHRRLDFAIVAPDRLAATSQFDLYLLAADGEVLAQAVGFLPGPSSAPHIPPLPVAEK